MTRKKGCLIAAMIVLVLFGLLLLFSSAQGRVIREAHRRAEFRLVVPRVATLVNAYTRAYEQDGAWPEPDTFESDWNLDYMGTRDEESDRIDTYQGGMHQLDFVLHADGSVEVEVVQWEQFRRADPEDEQGVRDHVD